MLDNKCKGTSMYYVITKGEKGDRSENDNFGLSTFSTESNHKGERGGQKTPNLHYVIHEWSLTNTNEKALKSVNNSDKRRQHVSKCLTFCIFISKIDLENPNPCPKNVILIRQ